MILGVCLLLAVTAVLGLAAARLPFRPGPVSATVGLLAPAVPLAVAAAVALAAPPAHGTALAAVRVLAVLAAMAGGSAVVTSVFGLTGTVVPDPAAAQPDGAPAPLRGGRAIGVLERAAIVVCVLSGFSAGLAVIVAAKGLARYPELRNPGAAEQFIIGTFVSVLWAAACAGVAVAVVR